MVSLATVPLLLTMVGAAIASPKLLLAQAPPLESTFTLPSKLPSGSSVELDGSSRMTVINETLQQRFEKQFAGTTVELASNGVAVDRSLLWWLLLPLLGLPLLLLWAKGRGTLLPPVVANRVKQGRIILTPQTCREVYANWEVPEEAIEKALGQGGRSLNVRLYDVTDIVDMDQQPPHSIKSFDCNPGEHSLNIPIAADNRDYIAELGYSTDDGNWLLLARSPQVRVPACAPVDGGIRTTAPVAGKGASAAGGTTSINPLDIQNKQATSESGCIILVPRNPDDAYVYWEVPEERKVALKQQGGRELTLRLHDATNVDLDRQTGHAVWQYPCREQDQDKHVPIPLGNRDYVVELGYVTTDNQWLRLVRSAPVRVGATFSSLERATRAVITPLTGMTSTTPPLPSNLFGQASRVVSTLTADAPNIVSATIPGGATTVAGTYTSARAFLERNRGFSNGYPELAQDCRIILVPRNSSAAYAYWEVGDSYKKVLHEQGGQQFMLRIHDVTHLDIKGEPPHSTQEYRLAETDQDKQVTIVEGDRAYIAELGYYTDDHQWLQLIHSFPVRVPDLNHRSSSF